MKGTALSRWAIVAGPAAAVAVGASTSTIRDQVGASNIGVALAIIVVGAALIDRIAALTTAIVAALTFNFFHTQPYHSLRIHSAKDVTVVALLAGLGLVVSDVSAWRHRRDAIAARHDRAVAAPGRLAEMLNRPRAVSEVWPSVTTSIMDQLALADCHLEEHQPVGMPLISRVAGRSSDGDDGFVLPSHGAAVSIANAGHTIGYLVIRPRESSSSLWVERRVVVALADHLSIALTYAGPPSSDSSQLTKESK